MNCIWCFRDQAFVCVVHVKRSVFPKFIHRIFTFVLIPHPCGEIWKKILLWWRFWAFSPRHSSHLGLFSFFHSDAPPLKFRGLPYLWLLSDRVTPVECGTVYALNFKGKTQNKHLNATEWRVLRVGLVWVWIHLRFPHIEEIHGAC